MDTKQQQLRRKINRRRDHAADDRNAWRRQPATPEQLRCLRRIATETGRTFSIGITRGEAWRRIRFATVLLSDSARSASAPPWSTPITKQRNR